MQQRHLLEHHPQPQGRGQDHQVDAPHHPHQQRNGAAKSLSGPGAGEQHVVGARGATGDQGKARQGKQPVQIHLNLIL